ncbi:MAG: SGNH/GDSL hydrolase family protein [Planctomycetes bacterium]|nr:SGNH/GDSL hydrolase family protein [Planctomycetota bacterium]
MNKQIFKNKPILKLLIKFLRYFIIAAVILVLGILAFLYFNIYLSQGSGPAGPNVPAKPFEYIWSKQNVLLLGIGDSITDGFGAAKGFSYFDRLIENPPQDSKDMIGKNLSRVFPKLKTKNIAVSCTVSSNHFEEIQKLNVQLSDVLGIVVMTTGGNDLIHNYGRTPPKECAMYGATLGQAQIWIENFEIRIDQMICEIKKKFPGSCHIFLANIYDPSDGTGNTCEWFTGLPAWPDCVLILRAYNEVISNCADKYDYVHLVNIHEAFLGHGIHCKKFWLKNHCFADPHYWYYLNIEDPNPRGYDAIRRLFLLEMIKVFSEKNTK